MSRRDENGAAVVMAVSLIAALMVLAALAAGIVAVVAIHRQLQASADLAALAGATAAGTEGSTCAAAARIAERNGGSLEHCSSADAEVFVVVSARLPRVLGGATLRARARAGPALGVEDPRLPTSQSQVPQVTMTRRSLSQLIASADDLADAFEAYEPEPADFHAALPPVLAVRLVAFRRAQAEKDLAEAVARARTERVSWRELGEAIGTSGEAVRQRDAASAQQDDS